MKVIILGGDGFCGWPTSLHLSNVGMDVVIADNLSRRRIMKELGANSLTPIRTPEERVSAWKEISGKEIKFVKLDIVEDYRGLVELLKLEKPDAAVHFAEQSSAPYSMKNSVTRRYTVDNNIRGTHNLLCAIVESKLDIHIVHLGTMGVYGYGKHGGKIPEGYLEIETEGSDGEKVTSEIMYPADPGSLYHTTKTLDALLFYYYNKNDLLRITDLHQGIVWGTHTPETIMDERLINRFSYDSDYGTVLNRFLLQAAVGHPLTVYGKGGQTRAFINIKDTVRCIEIALKNPSKKGARVKIFNQMTEAHSLNYLAGLISKLTGVEVSHIENPRVEAEVNNLDVENKKFLSLGLNPTTLSNGLIEEIMEIAKKYSHRCDKSKILPTSKWR